MEKEFVKYTEALALKELGFDEPCFGYYEPNGNFDYVESHIIKDIPYLAKNSEWQDLVSAPTYSQAFEWFREKYKLDCSLEDDVVEDDDGKEIQMWDFFIYKTNQKSDNKVMDFCSNNFNTYIESYNREEAELECLKKLIEIVKEK